MSVYLHTNYDLSQTDDNDSTANYSAINIAINSYTPFHPVLSLCTTESFSN